MILLTLSRGKGEETVRLQLPASPAEIGETFAFLDRISLDTTATAILDVSSNVPVLYRCLYDVDVEDSEQFQKLQKLAERTEALSPAKAAIFSGALDAECVWNLEGALTVADRLDEYMLVNNVSSDSELGIYLVNKGITPFPDRFKPYINYARVGAEYREKHGGEYEKELNGLHEMQAAVGGLIQAIYPFEDKVAVVCDDEGMLKPNEFNRSMPGGYGGVFGPFFVCGLGEDDFTSLTPQQMEFYKKQFHHAEIK